MTDFVYTIRKTAASFICALTFVSTIFTGSAQAQTNPLPTTASAKALLSGVTCESQVFCLYTQQAFRSGIASMTLIPRFYHMAIDCYVQAAIMGTKRYYDATARAGVPFTEAESGLAGNWSLASFCTEEVKDGGGVVLNAHVIANTRLLYEQSNAATSPTGAGVAATNPVEAQTRRLANQNIVGATSSGLNVLLEQYDARMKKDPKVTAATSTFDSPERFVSDILWQEYLSYSTYLRALQRSSSEVERAQQWADAKTGQSLGSMNWTSILRDQIESIRRADPAFDLRVAEATRDVADTMYTEFVRSYAEHLQYLIMRDNLRKVSTHLDSMERALATLSVKLRDAFVTGN